MGCCFSSQASSAGSHREHEQNAALSQQDSREQTEASPFPEALLAMPTTTPIAAPVALSENWPDIVEAITPNEAVEQSSSESHAPESSASDQHVILEPTVYVPPPRPSVLAELEEAPVQPPPDSAENRAKTSSSSSSSTSSSSG